MRLLPILSAVFTVMLVFPALAVTKEIPFGDFKIRLQQTTKKNGGVDAEVKVFNSEGEDVATKEFKNIQPSGGGAGLMLVKEQPLQKMYVLGKQGDFNPLLLIVNERGEIEDIPWAEVSKDKDSTYLIATQSEESYVPEYAIFDIKKQRVLYRVKNTEKKKYLLSNYTYKVFKKKDEYFLKGKPAVSSATGLEVSYLSISSRHKWLIDQNSRWGEKMEKDAEELKPLFPGAFTEHFEAFK